MNIVSHQTRTKVLDLLDKSARDKDAAGFMDTVGHQLTAVQALKTALESSFNDRDAQNQIGELVEQAARFHRQIESLDMAIQPILSLYLQTPMPYTVSSREVSEFVVHLKRHLETLVSRLEPIKHLDATDEPRKWLERYFWYPLTENILYAYWEHFGAYPPVGEGGTIEDVLRLLLDTVVEPPADLHPLVLETVNRLKRSERSPVQGS